MNINLRKILLGFLFCFLILLSFAFLLLNNAFIQEKIVSDYLLRSQLKNETYISVKDFDYNVFSHELHTDLFLIHNDHDTVLFLPDLDLSVNLYDILFTSDFKIEEVSIFQPVFNLSSNKEKVNSSYEDFFSLLSSFNKKISFSKINLSDVKLIYNDIMFDSIDVKIKDVLIEYSVLDIGNIEFIQDKSSINALVLAKNNQIMLELTSSIDKDNKLYDLIPYNFTNQLKYQNINFSTDLLFNQDSVTGTSHVKYGNSIFDIDFIKQKDFILFNSLSSNLDFQDFTNFPFMQNFIHLDDLSLDGKMKLIKQDSLDVYNGYFRTNYGDINFDLKTMINNNGNKSTVYHGNLVDIDLGSCMKQEKIGSINSTIDYSYNIIDSVFLTDLIININNIDINNYNYENIIINYSSEELINELNTDRQDLIRVKINDSSLDLDGEVSLSDFYLNDNGEHMFLTSASGVVNYIDLNNLNFNLNDSLDYISTNFKIEPFHMRLNLDGRSEYSQLIKPVKPIIKLKDFVYSKNSKLSSINYLNLGINSDKKNIFLNSSIGSLSATILDQDSIFLPLLFNQVFQYEKRKKISNFIIEGDLIKASFISDLMLNNLVFKDSLNFSFKYINNVPSFQCYSSGFSFFDVSFSDVIISTYVDDVISYNFEIDQIYTIDKSLLNKFSFTSTLNDNFNGSYFIKYNSADSQEKTSDIRGSVHNIDNSLNFSIYDNSSINLSNNIWRIDSSSELTINAQNIAFNNLSLKFNDELIVVDGTLGKDIKISCAFDNFNIDHINDIFVNKYLNYGGVLRGNIVVDQSLSPMLYSDFRISQFKLNNTLLGDLKLNNIYNPSIDTIYTQVSVSDNESLIKFNVDYSIDGTRGFNSNIKLIKFPVEPLGVFINSFADLKGFSTGIIKVHGLIDDYKINGLTAVENFSFKIPYLGTQYSNDNDSLFISFHDHSMIIDDFIFKDKKHNTYGLINAEIKHKSFKDISYEVNINSDSLFVLNTNKYDNEVYYGDGFLGGDLSIKGGAENIQVDINGQAKKGSKIMIPLFGSKEVVETKFVEFVNDVSNNNSTMLLDNDFSFGLNFNLDIDNNSEIQLIFDEEVGDLIKGHGDGSLYLRINESGSFEMFGDFLIEKGDYLFTLQDVITKSFEIKEGGGISFNGDPYSAQIDVNVLYKVYASLNPLNPEYNRNTKSLVICEMKLLDNLLNPDIQFFIEIPNSDQIVETSLDKMTNTDQKLLEQFLYLLIANSFLVENDPTVDYVGNTLSTTGTELLSSQLSNWLSQTTEVFDLGFKWIPGTGDSLSYQQIELAVSKKFLDDRVVVNGNVGTPPEQSEANIVGDVDIEYNFFKDGRLKLRVFNRTEDYDPLSESLGYEQGVGLFFKKQFNSFRELFMLRKDIDK